MNTDPMLAVDPLAGDYLGETITDRAVSGPLFSPTRRTLTAAEWAGEAQRMRDHAKHLTALASHLRTHADSTAQHHVAWEAAFELAGAIDRAADEALRQNRRLNVLADDARQHEAGAA